MTRSSFVPPSHSSRVRLHSSFLSTDDPVFLFALAPSFPLHHPLRVSPPNPGPRRPPFFASSPVPLRTPTACPWWLCLRAAPSHLRATRITLPSTCSPTPPCSFPLLFGLYTPACTTLTPSLHRVLRATSSSIITSTTARESRRCARGPPEAQAQHYDYDARSALKHHRTDISPFSAAPLLTPARATHCGGSAQLFCG
jgi:hypothetical protein